MYIYILMYTHTYTFKISATAPRAGTVAHLSHLDLSHDPTGAS